MATVAAIAAVSEICDKVGILIHFENSATKSELWYSIRSDTALCSLCMNCWLEITDTDGNPRTLAIILPEMPVNEKAAFVEHVCGVLLDSRFGEQVRRPWFENDIYVDLSLDVNEWPDYMFDLMPTSAIPERLIEETRLEMFRAQSMQDRSIEVQADSSSENVDEVAFSCPTTLGRGSPSEAKGFILPFGLPNGTGSTTKSRALARMFG